MSAAKSLLYFSEMIKKQKNKNHVYCLNSCRSPDSWLSGLNRDFFFFLLNFWFFWFLLYFVAGNNVKPLCKIALNDNDAKVFFFSIFIIFAIAYGLFPLSRPLNMWCQFELQFVDLMPPLFPLWSHLFCRMQAVFLKTVHATIIQ